MDEKIRIIIDGPRDARFNMAADLYLLKISARQPFMGIRIYQWATPTITLGYRQKAEELLDLSALKISGVTWIRRPTGGRAVLHEEDITYSFIFSKLFAELGTTISATYKCLSQCLIKGLGYSGINCQPANSNRVTDSQKCSSELCLPCFLAPNRDEIMINGRKLLGSAQKRTSHAVLQHGSIPITNKFRTLPHYQKIDNRERTVLLNLLHKKCACILECLEVYKEEKFIHNLIRGFQDTLPYASVINSWTRAEELAIQQSAQQADFEQKWMR